MEPNKKRKLEAAAEAARAKSVKKEEERAEEDEEEEEESEEEEDPEEEEDDQEEEEEQKNDDGDGEVSAEEVRALIEPFSKEQILDLLHEAAMSDSRVLSKIKKLADKDTAHRKLFIRGLGWEMTPETLKSVFAQYGNIEECSVIKDKNTGKSKGYGFVTFSDMFAARRALKEPSKVIEGRVTVSQLASVGPTTPSAGGGGSDHIGRKIYVGNVPQDVNAEKILSIFSQFGEIEEGPIGFDKSGKSKGYALIIYKSAASAKKALKEPAKYINGHQVTCKMATSDGGHHQNRGERGGGGGGSKVDMNNDYSLSQGGGLVGANPNLPYSPFSGLLPLNHGLLGGQHSLNPAITAQGLLALNANSGLTGLSPSLHQASLAHQLALGSTLNPSLSQSLNPSMNQSLNSSINGSLASGVSSQGPNSSLSSYGLHGLGVYGSQVGGGLGAAGGSSLYGGSVNALPSQSGLLHGGTAQSGYPSSHISQGQGPSQGQGHSGGGRSQSLSGYYGN